MQSVQIARPISLILDWDGTLTEQDTLALVANIGYKKQGLSPEVGHHANILPWSDYGSAYMQDYKAHKAQYRPSASERTTINEERHWLNSLQHTEHDSVTRVQTSGLFRGVHEKDICDAAHMAVNHGDLKLRTGWMSLLDKVLQNHDSGSNAAKSSVSILSVNWSAHFIRSSIIATIEQQGETPRHDLISYISSGLKTEANEIQGYANPEGSDGSLCSRHGQDLRTSGNKLSRLPQRCQDNLDRLEKQWPGENEATVIYLGDSDTDLEALLAADVGICIRNDPLSSSQKALDEIVTRLGIPLLRISDASIRHGADGLLWARDFDEIATSLDFS